MKKSILIIALFLFGTLSSGELLAQASQEEDIFKSSLQDFVIVTAAGFGGAILGLSTLPFTKEPSEHYRSILIGGSLGVIVGVSLVAWSQATKGRKKYQEINTGGTTYHEQRKYFGTGERVDWHRESFSRKQDKKSKSINQLSYTFTF